MKTTTPPKEIQFTEVEHKNEQNELSVLAFAFNQMMDKLEEYKYNLEQAKQELVQANHQLDQQNRFLHLTGYVFPLQRSTRCQTHQLDRNPLSAAIVH